VKIHSNYFTAKALELFMIALVTKGAGEARAHSSKRVTAQHLKTALMTDGQFDFLGEICENIPDEGTKKGRAKSEAKSEDSDEDMKPKKGKGGRKRKADSDDESD
jgi:Dr1-associated corepressor